MKFNTRDIEAIPGQRVEIIIIAEDNPKAEISQKLKKLFDKTQ